MFYVYIYPSNGFGVVWDLVIYLCGFGSYLIFETMLQFSSLCVYVCVAENKSELRRWLYKVLPICVYVALSSCGVLRRYLFSALYSNERNKQTNENPLYSSINIVSQIIYWTLYDQLYQQHFASKSWHNGWFTVNWGVFHRLLKCLRVKFELHPKPAHKQQQKIYHFHLFSSICSHRIDNF